ncbi:transcriptional coactivator p15/PC4 family protein [Burkholderia aenigmatica]|uniref:transcriptional coactivator p15/PC4 family protein n=1 Tax=Burkholderia aenigmatica TaxID=2015348 RepID=UPI00264ADCE0|nr:transcriptional coactivator p15/PC4 family protein [Burkholderia aenigmatica]MDN7875460.1 transcriptional coactivator p15/PC4 family protein [Burkholderia aenigmatica]
MQTKKMADPQASQDKKNLNSNANVNTNGAPGTCFLDLRRSDSERLRVTVSEYRGRTLIDVRVWFVVDGGEWKPGRAGVSLRPEQAGELMQALRLAALAADPKGAA